MKNIQVSQITKDRLLGLEVGDNGYIIMPIDKNVLIDHIDSYLSVGITLITPTTKRWSKEEIAENNKREQCMIFKNFSRKDKGKSREFITRCQTPSEAKKTIDLHNKNRHSPLQQGDKFYVGEEFYITENESIVYRSCISDIETIAYHNQVSKQMFSDQMKPDQSRLQGECLGVEVVKMKDIQPRNILVNYHRVFAEHNKLHNTNITPSMEDYVFLIELRRDK